MVVSAHWRMPPGLRQTPTVVATAGLSVDGAKIISDRAIPGRGPLSKLPPQMPDCQGGINQPPLDQNPGISIYNTRSVGVQQVPSQRGTRIHPRSGQK